jgi:hypothetical protein
LYWDLKSDQSAFMNLVTNKLKKKRKEKENGQDAASQKVM